MDSNSPGNDRLSGLKKKNKFMMLEGRHVGRDLEGTAGEPRKAIYDPNAV